MRKIVLVITGALMFLAGAAHWGLGWPVFRTELAAYAPESLRVGATAVWFFTSGAMFAFGAIVMTAGMRIEKNGALASATVQWVALFYVIFGAWSYFGLHHSLHFLSFVVLGLLAGFATLGAGESKEASR